MSLHIVLGASGTGKSKYVSDIVREVAKESLNNKCYMVVPDQFTLQTQVNMVKGSKCKGIMNIDVLSFSRLAHRVFEETNQGKKPILDDTGKSLILRKIAGDIKESTPYLAGNLDRIGFIHEVKSAISEFMQYGIGMEELEKLIEYSDTKGLLKNKLTDLSVIYSAFIDYLGDNFITTEEAMDLLSVALKDSKLMKDSVCVFDGFTGFTPVQIKVLKVLIKQCREVYITLTIDNDTDVNLTKEQDLFAFTVKSYKTLVRMATETGVNYKTIRMENNYRYADRPDMAALERRLFRYNQPKYAEKTPNITISCLSDADEEIRQLCVNLRELVSTNKAQYRDIAVIVGNMKAYEYRMRRIFLQYNIPVFWDKTKGIVLNSFVENTKAALKVLESDYSIDAVMRYLRTGMNDLLMEDVDLFEEFIHKKGIRGAKRYATLFVCQNNDETTTIVNQVREYVNDSLASFSGLGKKAQVSEYVNGLYEYYQNINAYEKLNKYASDFEETLNEALASEYSQIYVETMKLLEQVYGLLGDECISLEEFIEILEAGFGEIRIGSIPMSVDRILVGDMQRTRLKDVKYLFVLGMDDGNIPAKGSKSGIISDMEREYLAKSDYEMAPTVREKLYIEKFYLYSMLTKPSCGLFLSYCATNTEGNSVSPSYVIDMISGLFPKLTVTKKVANKWMISDSNTVYELKESVGRVIRRISEGELNDELKSELIRGIEALYATGKEGRAFIAGCIANSFYEYMGGDLDAKIAGVLYGTTLLASISRMEQFSKCAFAYFLKYGLELEEREERDFDSRDMGNIYHGVMEAFGQTMKARGLNWFDIDEDTIGEIIDEAIEVQAHENDSKLFDNGANQYIYKRMKQALCKAIKAFSYHLKQGRYQIEELEVGFERIHELDTVNQASSKQQKMKLNGRIDRVDTYVNDDKVYVKVVDYKSNDKDFSLMDFYLGTQLQLVVYLDEGMKIASKNHVDKEVVPAAMLYCKLNESISEVSEDENEESINQKIINSLRATGLVSSEEGIIEGLTDVSSGKSDVIKVSINKDGTFRKGSQIAPRTVLDLLSRYATYKLDSIGKQLIEGNIKKNPIKVGEKESCQYCEYRDACGFDKKKPGYRVKTIEKLDDGVIIEKIREELEEEE